MLKLLAILPLFAIMSCDPSACSIIGPSSNSFAWSPFLGVHASGEAHDAYRTMLPLLRDNGNLRGVRVGITPSEGINETIKMIGSLGIELVCIIDSEYLLDPNIEARIDEIYRDYPEINYFQVGNEVTNPDPEVNSVTMSLVQYMVALRRVYDHTQRLYLDKMLLTQSTFGTGDNGAIELEQMVGLGLREMSNQKLIIGINVYSEYALVRYSDAIRKNLSGYRIWVMETGIDDPSQQINFVKNFYPQFRTSLRAERIYWYAAWVGDSGPQSGYGLFWNVLNPPIVTSPLFDRLTGVQE